ncbi:MAG: hypothetical protein COA42_12485 [Alteromonadaceae bacterium]|nr:MAG: hypothetical protein COA42_12485 [Alteromonadaceae bacterium]
MLGVICNKKPHYSYKLSYKSKPPVNMLLFIGYIHRFYESIGLGFFGNYYFRELLWAPTKILCLFYLQ